MVRTALWRLAHTVLAVWALASVVFLFSYRDPEAAIQLALPDTAALGSGPASSALGALGAERQAVRHRLGLDLPLFYLSRTAGPAQAPAWHWHGTANQYHRWLTRLLHGDLGTSFRTGQPVAARLGEALAVTVPLTGSAALLAAALALGLATRMAAGPWWQPPVRAALATLHALPLFVVALALLLLFANPEAVAWFPAYGLASDAPEGFSPWGRFLDALEHLVLPLAALVLTALPELALQLESALTQELRANYATTARAKGLTEPAVIWRHALRNALLPALTVLAELLPALVGGAVVVEVVFALPGMGRLLAAAAAARDYPVLVGGVLLSGAARLLALLLADLLYLWADPRIRWQR